MTIELFYAPGYASMTPHILLEEIGAPFKLTLVDAKAGAHRQPEYLKLNPNASIPVFRDGDLVLYETAAICLHLVDTNANAHLAPAIGTAARAHFYKWLVWMTNTLQAALMLESYPERWVGEVEAARFKDRIHQKIAPMLDQLDAAVAASGGPWLLGKDFSAVDPYAMMLCRWTRKMDRPARSLTHLQPYLERVLARPSVQRALATEGLTAPFV